MSGIHNTNNKGFTLVEAIIAIGLFTALVTVAVGGFVHALHTQRQVANLISAQSNVSLAMEQMAREIRTGYLFCHPPNDAFGNGNVPNASCGCTVNGAIWTCKALDFFNAQSEDVVYASSAGGALTRSDSAELGGVASPLTGNDVTLKHLSFVLRGHLEGDGWTPFVTISLGVSASSSDPAIQNTILHFQTSISARQIDCDPITSQC